MDAADLLPGEQVQVVDIDNGARLETYVIAGPRGSGVIGINGAAARLVHPGDLVIIMSYAAMSDAEARAFEPRVVHVDRDNRIVALGSDPAEPVPGTSTVRGDAVVTMLLHRHPGGIAALLGGVRVRLTRTQPPPGGPPCSLDASPPPPPAGPSTPTSW